MFITPDVSAAMKVLPLGGGENCVVIDEFLTNPEEVVGHAANHADEFANYSQSLYPGVELHLDRAVYSPLLVEFRKRWRKAFSAGRPVRESRVRLCLVTRGRAELMPQQRICHRDSGPPDPYMVIAGTVYLFRQQELGGTSFFKARRDPSTGQEARLTPEGWLRHFESKAGYMAESDAFFDKILEVPAAFNRAVLYPGHVRHSAAIRYPEMLNADPSQGRLTLNFFLEVIRV